MELYVSTGVGTCSHHFVKMILLGNKINDNIVGMTVGTLTKYEHNEIFYQ